MVNPSTEEESLTLSRKLGDRGDTYFLNTFLSQYPLLPSLALWRAVEAKYFSVLPLQEPVLDLGCGNGFFGAVAFAGKVHSGIDMDPVQVKRAASKNNRYRFAVAGDAGQLPYKDGSFATVVSNCVIEHIENLEQTLREVSRVLVPAGKFFFTVPTDLFNEWFYLCRLFRRLGLPLLAKKQIDRYNRYQFHYHMYPIEEWDARLQQSGLRLIRYQCYASRGFQLFFSALDDLEHVFAALIRQKSSSSEAFSSQANENFAVRTSSAFLKTFWSFTLTPVVRKNVIGKGKGAGVLLEAEKPGNE